MRNTLLGATALLSLMVGSAQAANFATTDAFQNAGSADIICARRSSAEELPFPYPHRYARNSVVQISSSMVRERIAAGRPFRRLLAPQVYSYIVERGLYGFR